MWMRINGRRAQGAKREARSAEGRDQVPQIPGRIKRWNRWAGIFTLLVWWCPAVSAEGLKLQDLIDEALRNNPELGASQAGVQAAGHKIPQVGSLPDPMVMVGYQNEGYNTYNYGDSADAQFMVSVSQMFPFYGKRGLKAEMAGRDAESLKNVYRTLRLKTISKVKELYNDLFLAYKNRDLLQDKGGLLRQVEEAALARYASGMAPQQEVVMAQTEKYMLLERQEMADQKIQATEGMLNAAVGRDVGSPLGRPAEVSPTPHLLSLDDLLGLAKDQSTELKAKAQMVQGTEAKIKMAQKEYYPDFTLGANLFKRSGIYQDMWNLTATINIPLFYRDKQRQGVLEAEAAKRQAQKELQATEIMLASSLRENYSMIRSGEKLMKLYQEGLLPKARQDIQLSLSGYVTGKVEAITVISRLKTLLDIELLYWSQMVEREKAIARLEPLTGLTEIPTQDERNEKK
jgi:cobalt-zinc-cadmium efflux system outer membrane protein